SAHNGTIDIECVEAVCGSCNGWVQVVAWEDVGCFSHGEAVSAAPMLDVGEGDFTVNARVTPGRELGSSWNRVDCLEYVVVGSIIEHLLLELVRQLNLCRGVCRAVKLVKNAIH